MTFEAPQANNGIEERDGEFFVTDPEVLKILEAREAAIKTELVQLETKINEIVTTLSSNEKMNDNLVNVLTRTLENTLTRLETLRENKVTLH